MKNNRNVSIKGLKKSYINNDKRKNIVFNNFNISFDKEKIHCVLGASGCGKSTLLKIIIGLEEYEKGIIAFNNELNINDQGSLSILLQDDNLLPWLTVHKNVELGVNYLNNKEKPKQINKSLKKCNVHKYKNYYPFQLSSGLKQKVALAKALASKPNLLILDEAFCSLDFLSKCSLHKILLSEFSNEKFTAILSTHDIEEACKLGDYIHLLGSNDKYKKIKNPLKKPREKDKDYYSFINQIKKEYM